MAEWCAVGTVPEYRDGGSLLRLPFDLGGGVMLEPLPEWAGPGLQAAAKAGSIRPSAGGAGELALVRRYPADSPGAPDPQWRGDTPRSVQEAVDAQLGQACLAVWLSRPSRLLVDRVLHFEAAGDGRSLRGASGGCCLELHPYDQDSRLEMSDLELARLLFSRLGQLSGEGAVTAALRAASAGLRETAWGTRFVLLWVGMEALFGSVAPQEAAWRTSQRAALFLAESRAVRRQVFDAVMGSYWARCRAVHGTRLSGLGAAESIDLSYQVQEWLRAALVRILQDTALTARIDGRERETHLDAGLFD